MSRVALIAGAGIGGLAAGIALRRAGWQVRIFEQSPVPRAVGFALGLAPNAMAALRELGVETVVRTEGFPPARAEVRRPNGQVLRRVDVSRLEASLEQNTMLVLRPVLHGALLDAVGREQVQLDSEVTDFLLTRDGVVVKLAGGGETSGDVLIGADGVASVIRRRLHPDEPPPRRSGHWAIRGVAYDATHALGDLSAVMYFGDGLESATVRAGRNAIYWYISLLARDLPADTRDPRRVTQQLTAGFEARYHDITRATKDNDIRLDELFDRDPVEAWGKGPVTLLGDAAHPMLPHTGQGAAQALEDAVALGLVLSGNGDPPQALRRYEEVRSRRSGAIVRHGRRIARVTTTRNKAVQVVRDAAVRLVPALALKAAFALSGRRDVHRELRTSGSVLQKT
jgi:2-polyprenyl-6-methoxyphenol hydroxylase-like FAD-dependent oxidoreductase